ncbi:hypothetical protein M9458_053623, partial [Cirrhinus mrigala]
LCHMTNKTRRHGNNKAIRSKITVAYKNSPMGAQLEYFKLTCERVKEANEMNNNFQKQIIELKKAKLALEERRLSLEEMRFARPSISLPIILPDES